MTNSRHPRHRPAGDARRGGHLVSVLVADPQRLVADALAAALSDYSGLAIRPERPTTGEDAVSAVIRTSPDVVLLDYRMPDMPAGDVVATIKEAVPKTKVLVLSWLHGPRDIELALDAGAAGFFTKNLTIDRVAEGILRAHGGESPVYLRELDDLFTDLSKKAGDAAYVLQRLSKLSPRENEVLMLLSLERSSKEIAGELGISPATVNMHIRNMLRKTEAFSARDVLVMARFAGLIRN